MKLSDAGELSFLEILRKRFGKKTKAVALGIGDDSAVINPGDSQLLLATDMMAEGVHFDLSWTTPFQLGFKLVSVNVSDIFAMGGKPQYLLLNFSAGRDATLAFFTSFFDGIEAAMKKYRISLIGGDISASEKVVLSATVAGQSEKYISRKGARAGDRIYVTGNIGDAACGLELMKKSRKRVAIELGRKQRFPLPWDIVSPLIERHLMPTARDPRRFKKDVSAMIDISDGLMIDLSRLCRESRVGALVYADRIPMSKELKEAACHIGLDPLDLALNGGEDYELLFTAPAGKRAGGCCIGEIIRSGIFLMDEKGQKRRAPIKGYQHFKL